MSQPCQSVCVTRKEGGQKEREKGLSPAGEPLGRWSGGARAGGELGVVLSSSPG